MTVASTAAFANDPQATAILRRRALAERLMQQAAQQDFRHPLSIGATAAQSLAGVLGQHFADRELRQHDDGQRSEANQFMAALLRGGAGGEGVTMAPGGGSPPSGAAAVPAVTPAAMGGAGGIRTGARIAVPTELDDADILARTLIGEAANQGEEGQRAVAHVIRNRMNQTGAGVRDVVLAPHQFEPWGARRQELLGIQTTDPRYIVARNIAESALGGQSQDPTSGATHFLNPDLQRRLGRQQPSWAPEGQGQRIGAHVFYRPGGGVRTGADPNIVAASTPAAAPAAPAAPQAPAGPNYQQAALGAMMSRNPHIARMAPVLAGMGRQEAQARPTVQMVGPEGPGVYERLPNGQTRFLGGLPETAPLSPERFTQQRALAEAGRTSVEQRVSMEPERAEGARRGTDLAEEGTRIRLAAETAAGTIDSIQQVRALGANTDRLAPMRETVGSYLEAMGVPASASRLVREAGTLQAFTAAANNIVLGRQLEQRGVQTEGDREVMRQTFATVTNTNDANDMILRAVEGQATRAMERAEFYQNWRQQPGADGRPRNSLDGASEAWNRYIRETPMVARTGSGMVFLHEWLPAAIERLNGDQEAALRLWRENAAQRRR